MSYQFASEEDRAMRVMLFTPCKTKEEVKQWCYVFLNIELPDTCVDPESNSNMLDMVWTCYSHIVHGPESEDANRYLFFSSRFSGKTLCESIIEVMVLLHARIDVTHLAALERQSRDCQKYIAKFYNLPYLKGILLGDNKREKAATFYTPQDGGPNLTEREWKTLSESEQPTYTKVVNTVEVIVASVAAANGKHTALLCLDEIDVMANKEAFEEAKNIPTPTLKPDGTEYEPLTLLTSTRKFAFGLVSREIQEAEETGLIIRNWNVLDICKACPKSRHRPDLPKREMYIAESLLSSLTPEAFGQLSPKEKEPYTRIEAYEGCVSNCKILPACKTYLATRQTSTSKFLKKISYIQNQIKANSLDKALAQLLCRKPSTAGLIYPTLSRARHMLQPWQVYEKVSGQKCVNPKKYTKQQLVEYLRSTGGEWFAGMDWGFTHLFAFVMGIKLGNTLYVTHAYGESGLSPAQKIDACERFKHLDPKCWGDTEDPSMIKAFKLAGWRMAQWKKGGVADGISTVGMKLTPTLGGEPELYFVKDIEEDPMMDLLFLHMAEHHYKLGPDGQPTKTPADDEKDFPDALRYMVVNLFPLRGTVTVTEDVAQPNQTPVDSDGQRVYAETNWMTQRINELTGNYDRQPVRNRPPMTIEEASSYYGEQNKEAEAKKGQKGQKRGIIWDFGE